MRPSGPPTDSIPVWTIPGGVDRDTGQAVVDLALRAGVAMLATGASAADVTATVLMLTRAYGLTSVHVDVTYTSLTVSYHRGPHADPMTVMRIVPFRSQDFTRLERLRALIVSLTREQLPVDDARVRFDGVVSSPHPYRRWLVTAAGGALAAGAAALVGAGPFIVLVSFVTALVVGRVMAWLSSAGVASFFAQSVGAAIPTLVATLVVALQSRGVSFFGDVSPSLVVASGIVLLLSGLSVVGAAEDALEGYYVTAGARAFEVVVLSLGIAVGVSTVLSLGQRVGFPIAITSHTRVTDRLGLQVVCAVVIAVAFAAMSYARGRVIAAAGVAGALGWLVLALGEHLGIGSITGSAIAAATIGFVTRVAAPRLGYSALAVTTAAIVPLLPGRLAYQGISEIVSRPDETGVPSGLTTVAQAFGTGLALAAGVAMGTYFAGLIQAKRPGERPRAAAAASRRTDTRRGDGPTLSDTGDVPTVGASGDDAPRRHA
jgi:uncharacterized membrane protein YjjP (DUF1212 family)